MALVQRARFATFLKNLTGFRGPLDLPLQGELRPVFDISSDLPELDDEVARWYTSGTQAALAGNFSAVGLQLGSGVPAGTRAVVDGLILTAQAALINYNIGITAPATTPALQAAQLSNNFLGSRGSVYTLPQASLGAVQQWGKQAAASIFSGTIGFSIQVTVPPNTVASTLVFAAPNFPRFVIQPGWVFSVEPTGNNTAVFFSAFGRYYGDQQ